MRMLYEKTTSKVNINPNFIGLAALLMVFTALFTYGACLIYGVAKGYNPNQSIGPLDLLNGGAQIATAAAFVLALIQYKKSTAQQRQATISAEAISQIEKATKIISETRTGQDTSLEQLNKSITLLSNLGTNISELFKAMEEGVYKAIVRMHWQDMHFNHVRHVFSEIDGAAAIRRELHISNSEFEAAIQSAQNDVNEANPLPAFREFVFLQKFLDHPNIKHRFSLKNRFDSLDLFCVYYLNDYEANDLLYGVLSRIDVRACAPLLAVAEPSAWALSRQNA